MLTVEPESPHARKSPRRRSSWRAKKQHGDSKAELSWGKRRLPRWNGSPYPTRFENGFRTKQRNLAGGSDRSEAACDESTIARRSPHGQGSVPVGLRACGQRPVDHRLRRRSRERLGRRRSGGNDGGSAPPASCGQVRPCGGDVVGTWAFLGACSNAAALSAELAAICPGASVSDYAHTKSGFLTFNADLTYISNVVKETLSSVRTRPFNCESDRGLRFRRPEASFRATTHRQPPARARRSAAAGTTSLSATQSSTGPTPSRRTASHSPSARARSPLPTASKEICCTSSISAS